MKTRPAPEFVEHRASPQRVAGFRGDVDVNSPNELPQHGPGLCHCAANMQLDLLRRRTVTKQPTGALTSCSQRCFSSILLHTVLLEQQLVRRTAASATRGGAF